MEPTQALGFAHFFAQTDMLARALLAILLAMSLATWYLIAAKSLEQWLERQRSRRFLEDFWRETPAALPERLAAAGTADAFSHLARSALAAHRKGDGEFLTRAMRRVIDEDTARLESGLTLLASIGTTAPF